MPCKKNVSLQLTNIFRVRPFSFPIILCSFFLMSCGSKSQNDSAPRNPNVSRSSTIQVKGVVTVLQPVDNVVLSSGTVLASESVDLVAEVGGTVERIVFREGDHVKKGDLLLKIKDDDLQAQLKKLQLQIKLAADVAERQEQLFKTGNTSKEQYDIATSTLATLQADQENLLASIRKREIRAPFDGTIGLRYVSVGSYVSPTTRVASIQKVNPVKVDFAIPEKYANKVRVGDPVNFSSEESSLRFSGRVYAIEPQIEPTTRTVQLRALCDNPDEKIFPGGYVHVELRLSEPGGAIMVPTQAIVPVLKGQTVLVAKNGVVKTVPVKTGIRTSSTIQITEGLSVGDTVITTGLLQLRPGMPVNVVVN
jgi:membrane fusion protein (multidrug efflux system)